MRGPALLAITLMSCSMVVAQGRAPDTSAKGLSQDLVVLRRALRELHPGLYRYNTPAQIDAAVSELGVAWSKDQSLADAYLSLSTFLAKIKCGHTYANFFNQPVAVAKPLFQQRDKAPFCFRWIGNRMIVTRDLTKEASLPRGTEILSIDGVPATQILAKLMTVARADGSNDDKRKAYLQVEGAGEYEAFDVFHPLFYPNPSGRFVLVTRKPGAKVTSKTSVDALSFAEKTEPLKRELDASRREGAAWRLEFLQSKVAYVQMKTWALYDDKWDWKEAIDDMFTELISKETPNLIIDLRGNEGGSAVGDAIVAHLISRPVPFQAFQRFVKYKRVPVYLRPYLDTYDSSLYDWGEVNPYPNGMYRIATDDERSGTLLQPIARPYRGRVFVLIDSTNSSATFLFAEKIRQYKLGTLVGEPTGGSQRGINGSAFFFLRLPNSRFEVDLPLVAQLYSGVRPDAGIRPDIYVAPSVEDIVEGRDPVLARVLKLISKTG